MSDTFDRSTKLKLDSFELEHSRFCKTSDDKIAVRIKEVGGLINFDWDNVTIDSSDPLINRYNFTNAGTVAGTIELRYTDSCKEKLLSVGRV